jgi:peptide/nickel transport system permease protein
VSTGAGAPPPPAVDPVGEVVVALGPPRDDGRLARRERVRVLLHSKSFIAGAIIVGFFLLCAVLGKALVLQDPFASSPINGLEAPSADNWFGTDRLGRDVFSRVIVGSRDIMLIAPAATLLGTVVGTALGLVTGYFRGAVDDILSRIIEAFLALPVVLVAVMALVSLGPSNLTIIVVVGIVFAPIIARTVRAAVLTERELEYVSAARLRNERTPYILFAEILPNVFGPVIVEFTVRLGYAIFVVATLSFLGFGVQPPAPDWGLQIFDHYGLISGGYWWPVLFPAAAIAILVIGVNLMADGLTQAFER